MILNVFSLLMATQAVASSDGVDQIATAETAFEIFDEICFSTFPDPDAAIVAIDSHTAKFEKQTKTGMQAQQPGDLWFSGDMKITYASAEWLPRDLPSPQCSVSTPFASDQTHRELAAAFISRFNLPEGKIGKDKPRASSRWDMPGMGNETWRIFLSTETTDGEKSVRISLLNLRGKK